MTTTTLQTFEPDGRAIPFIDEGEGFLVVLLPGRGLTIASLGMLASVVEEEGFRVLRVGYREPHEDDDSGVTLHDLAHDVIDVLDHLGIGRAWVGGHAFGGAVARTVALDAPDRVEGLVLLGLENAEPGDDARHALDVAYSEATDAAGVAAMGVLAGAAADADFAWNVFSRTRDLAGAHLHTTALTSTAAGEWEPLAARIPVLIVTGTEDRVAGQDAAEALRATAPTRASLSRVDGAGHLLVLTHPGEIGAEIEDYLGWD